MRCTFTRPELEERWNAWYSGPKLAEMMTHPLFLSGQRYRAVGLDQRALYLAVWVVESPDAFTTPEYKSTWGFVEWTPHIADWSRNLYRGPAEDVSDRLDVPPDGGLCLAAFDAVPETETASRLRVLQSERPDVLWMAVAGLDRSCPAIGLRRLVAADAPPQPLRPGLGSGIREMTYRPISDRRRAKRA